ncbi:pyridoxamine 5'-phosphate oxidase family protein [Thiocapsa sp.]|uniref:pyridoxamine 5'-phosphate oxidase family protein n=1 Tax=Thiocapsa sp. TaxID=2024551 RepID=UPI002D80AE06|nr:pyridoxamine 5'-phosphate oxidase family protein [Thiocapsa sp.]
MSSEPSTDASSSPDLDAIYEELQRFRAGFSTLSMATCGPDGEPDASYAPYLGFLDEQLSARVSQV